VKSVIFSDCMKGFISSITVSVSISVQLVSLIAVRAQNASSVNFSNSMRVSRVRYALSVEFYYRVLSQFACLLFFTVFLR